MGEKLSTLTSLLDGDQPLQAPQNYSLDPETCQLIDAKAASLMPNRKIYKLVSTGLRSDFYREESKGVLKTCPEVENKKILCRNHRHQTASVVSLATIYPFVSLDSAGGDSVGGGCFWAEVRMPTDFGYTTAVVHNQPFLGLLHSYLRHAAEWHLVEGVEPAKFDDSTTEKLHTAIAAAPTESAAKDALNRFTKHLQALRNKRKTAVKYDHIQSQLAAVQARMQAVINDQVVGGQNYLGEGVSDFGDICVHYKCGKVVMVFGVSSQLYPPLRQHSDPRPVRTVNSIAFIARERYGQAVVAKTWDGPLAAIGTAIGNNIGPLRLP